jgi:hypothetical protein
LQSFEYDYYVGVLGVFWGCFGCFCFEKFTIFVELAKQKDFILFPKELSPEDVGKPSEGLFYWWLM